MFTASSPTPNEVGSVLIHFFSSNNKPELRFFKAVRAAVSRNLRRHFKGADNYLQREVLAETLLALCVIRHKGLRPLIFNGEKYLYGIVRDAIKRVRSKYKPIGHTNGRSRMALQKYKSLKPLSLDDIKDSVAADDRTEERFDAVLIISRARGRLRRALELIYKEQFSIPEATRSVGLSESTLRRMLKQFALQLN